MPKKYSFLATQEVKGRGNSNQLLDRVDHPSELGSVLSTLVILFYLRKMLYGDVTRVPDFQVQALA